MSWVPWTCISAVWTETWLLQLNITIKLQVLDYVAVSIVPAPAPHHLWPLPGRSVGLDILYWAGNKRVWSFTITEKAPTYALVGAFFQPGEGPGRGLLCDCETSNFAKVRFQLYWVRAAASSADMKILLRSLSVAHYHHILMSKWHFVLFERWRPDI